MFQFAHNGLSWLIPVFIVFAVGFAYWMYRREVKLSEAPRYLRIAMAVLRGLILFLLLFLLLQPTYISKNITYTKPALLVGIDNSRSVAMFTDTAQLKSTGLPGILNDLNKLEDKFDIHTFVFDQAVRSGEPNFSGEHTNYGVFFDEMSARFEGRNPGAIVLISDGNSNTGIDPVYSNQLSNVPVFTVGLGDSVQRPDVRIAAVHYGKTMLFNSANEIRVELASNVLLKENLKLTLSSGGKNIGVKNVQFSANRIQEISFEIRPEKIGFQKFILKLDTLPLEYNRINNKQELYFDVIDKKKKIWILAENISPDITAIRQALQSNINLDVEFFSLNNFSGKPNEPDVVIFVQTPSKLSTDFIRKYLETGKPFVMLAGPKTNFKELNKLNLGVQIEPKQLITEYSQVYLNKALQSSHSAWQAYTFFTDAPPLITPLANIKAANSSEVIFFRKYKSFETQQPVMLSVKTGNSEGLVLLGEGIWQWRLYEAEKNGNTLEFDRFVNEWIGSLSARPVNGRLVLNHPIIFTETNRLEFMAETYDENLKPFAADAVKISINNVTSKFSDFSFVSGNRFKTLLNVPEKGVYTYQAIAYFKSDSVKISGQFAVADEQIEFRESEPDFEYLKNLAASRGGESFGVNQINDLVKKLEDADNIKKLASEKTERVELIHLKFLFFILLLFASLEWFWRKYYGHI